MPFSRYIAVMVVTLGVLSSATAQSVLNYELNKQHNFSQTSDSGAVEAGFVKYSMVGYVNVADGDTIAQPSYTTPSGFQTSRTLVQLGTTNDWTDSASYTAKGGEYGFDNAMGNGDFIFTVNDTAVTMTVNPETYWNASNITGGTWDASKLQLNNAGATVITFSDPTGGDFVNGTDFIRLVLRQQSVGTSFVFESSTLVNSFTIGAGNLVDGATYDLELRFFNITDRDSTSISGAIGLSGFSTQTFAEVFVSNMAAVPEPSTYALILGGAVLGLSVWRRRRSG
jgi:hypothetical protein